MLLSKKIKFIHFSKKTGPLCTYLSLVFHNLPKKMPKPIIIHFLHILADFHEKLIKKKRFIKFSKKDFFLVLLKKSIFEALHIKISHPLNKV